MKSKIVKSNKLEEFYTPERCFISELWNQPGDASMSIAIARVEPGIKTRLHYLDGVTERYLIIEGKGRVEIEDSPITEVNPGDLVIIPKGKTQRIENIGKTDLKFYCVCNPQFNNNCYHDVEED
jgi:mannose-6-phosphate isomerase-like protein (cupin superfamily)